MKPLPYTPGTELIVYDPDEEGDIPLRATFRGVTGEGDYLVDMGNDKGAPSNVLRRVPPDRTYLPRCGS